MMAASGRARRRAVSEAALAGAAGVLAAALAGLLLPFLCGAVGTADPAVALRWYGSMAGNEGWRLAVRNSLAVGAGAALVATVAGTAAAFLVRLGRRRWTGVLLAAGLPVVLPAACAAFALLAALAALGVAGRFRGLVLAHAVLGLPFVVAAVLLALRRLGPMALPACASLGVPPGTLLGRVVLPLAWPGITAGALLAFAASLGELVAAELLAPVGQPTVPRRVLAGLRDAPRPEAYAAAALLVLSCLLLAGGAALLLRLRLGPVLRGRQVG